MSGYNDPLTVENPHIKKTYLGDGVYIHFDGFHYVLTTENGYGPTNTIALDPHVTQTLMNHISSNQGDHDEPEPIDSLKEKI